jgi:hypothetical protein
MFSPTCYIDYYIYQLLEYVFTDCIYIIFLYCTGKWPLTVSLLDGRDSLKYISVLSVNWNQLAQFCIRDNWKQAMTGISFNLELFSTVSEMLMKYVVNHIKKMFREWNQIRSYFVTLFIMIHNNIYYYL